MYIINNKLYYKYLSWLDIYIGVKNQKLNKKMAINFAEYLIEYNKCDIDLLIEFFIDDNIRVEEILNIIKSLINNELITQDSKSIDKLRYILLIEARELFNNNNELLEKIEDIYSSFNYPEDMIDFIYYMPNNKNITFNSPDEYTLYTIKLFDDYLVNLKIMIKSL
ncbi:MAG: DUF2247 family protein [bacterium]